MAQFGLVVERMDRGGVVARCLSMLEQEGPGALEVAGLRGVGREAAMLRLLVQGRVGIGGGSSGNVRRGDSFSPGKS